MSDLEERFYKKYDEAKFNVLEMTGFKYSPRLAVVAGIAIGYRMALDDFQPKLEAILDGNQKPIT